ncbi:hypothetical protein Tco_1192478 [Tanacetum coccineum]
MGGGVWGYYSSSGVNACHKALTSLLHFHRHTSFIIPIILFSNRHLVSLPEEELGAKALELRRGVLIDPVDSETIGDLMDSSIINPAARRVHLAIGERMDKLAAFLSSGKGIRVYKFNLDYVASIKWVIELPFNAHLLSSTRNCPLRKEIDNVQLGIVKQAELKLLPKSFFSFCTAAL